MTIFKGILMACVVLSFSCRTSDRRGSSVKDNAPLEQGSSPAEMSSSISPRTAVTTQQAIDLTKSIFSNNEQLVDDGSFPAQPFCRVAWNAAMLGRAGLNPTSMLPAGARSEVMSARFHGIPRCTNILFTPDSVMTSLLCCKPGGRELTTGELTEIVEGYFNFLAPAQN